MVKFLGEFKFEDLSEEFFCKFSELENFENDEFSIRISYDKILIKSEENYLIEGPKIEISLEEDFCNLKLFRDHPIAEIFPDWELSWDEYFEDINIETILDIIYNKILEIEEEED